MASSGLPVCRVCKQPIFEEEPVVSKRGRAPVHVRCWRPADAEKEDVDEETPAA